MAEFMCRFKINQLRVWLVTLIWAAIVPALADPAADQARLAVANTGFAFDLFQQIVREQPDANVFISPVQRLNGFADD